MSETEVQERRLVVNGQATTQEVIRANADQTLDSFPNTPSAECGMAETILAVLDLLEANQRLVVYLCAGDDDEE